MAGYKVRLKFDHCSTLLDSELRLRSSSRCVAGMCISAPTKEEEQRERYQRRQSFNSLSPKHPKLIALADACAKERKEWGKSLKLHLILIQRYVFSEGGWRVEGAACGCRGAGKPVAFQPGCICCRSWNVLVSSWGVHLDTATRNRSFTDISLQLGTH
jgi:hypothetical protein